MATPTRASRAPSTAAPPTPSAAKAGRQAGGSASPAGNAEVEAHCASVGERAGAPPPPPAPAAPSPCPPSQTDQGEDERVRALYYVMQSVEVSGVTEGGEREPFFFFSFRISIRFDLSPVPTAPFSRPSHTRRPALPSTFSPTLPHRTASAAARAWRACTALLPAPAWPAC